MGGTEVGEDRIGDVGVEHLRRPCLPFEEERCEPRAQVICPVRLEQANARWRRSGPRLEADHQDLTALERAVQAEEIGDAQSQGAEAEPAGYYRYEARESMGGRDISKADGQQRRPGVVEDRAEIGKECR